MADVPVATEVITRTAILPTDQQTVEGLRELFELEDLDGSKKHLAAVAKPFSAIHEWPANVGKLLEELARKTANLEPQTEVDVMSASWNAIWAVVNICREFGDIVEDSRSRRGQVHCHRAATIQNRSARQDTGGAARELCLCVAAERDPQSGRYFRPVDHVSRRNCT